MRYAGFWRRAAAHAIDFGLTNLASWAVEEAIFGSAYGVMYLLARARGGVLKPYDNAFDPMLEQVVSVVVYAAIVLPYYIWFTYRKGWTPGKRWLRIRVISDRGPNDGGPVTLKQSVIRCLGYIPSYAAAGCGFFMAAFHSRKLALHDLFAGTVSVIDERAGEAGR